MSDPKQKFAVVTGATGTIGRAVITRLLKDNVSILAVDIDEEALADLSVQMGNSIHTQLADVTDENAVATYAVVAKELGRGRVDFFFNNAGIEGAVATLTEQDVTGFGQVMAVNVRGVFLGLKHILPLMGTGGVVVNSGSTASLRGAAGFGPYIASKHAVLGLTRTAALEVANLGIRVCAVCPGPVEGRMMDRIKEQRKQVVEATPPTPGVGLENGRLATVDEIAGAIMFLFSREANFVTGVPLIVDGGRSA